MSETQSVHHDNVGNPTTNYERIRKLARQINKIRDKHQLINIINIIKTINPTLSITENENGMFIKFNALEPDTYDKLENYMHNITAKRITPESESLSLSEYVPYTSDDM